MVSRRLYFCIDLECQTRSLDTLQSARFDSAHNAILVSVALMIWFRGTFFCSLSPSSSGLSAFKQGTNLQRFNGLGAVGFIYHYFYVSDYSSMSQLRYFRQLVRTLS